MNCKDSRFLFVLFFFILTIIESTGIQVYSNDPGSPGNTSSFGSLKHENQFISFQSTDKENQEKSNLTARPTAPNPKTATVDPFVGFATFKVAPRPVFLYIYICRQTQEQNQIIGFTVSIKALQY